jgi:hypothetical protein
MTRISINKAFCQIQKLYEFRRCLQEFRRGFSGTEANRSDGHQIQDLTNWMRARMSDTLTSSPKVYPQDAAALIEIGKEYDEKMEVL